MINVLKHPAIPNKRRVKLIREARKIVIRIGGRLKQTEVAKYFSQINKYTRHYPQSQNLRILGNRAPSITCNVTSLSMALEALGISPSDFTGDKTLLKKIASASKALSQTTQTTGTLENLRMPDYLQLVAVYIQIKSLSSPPDFLFTQAQYNRAVQKASGMVWKKVQVFRWIATLFGVNCIAYSESRGIKSFGGQMRDYNLRKLNPTLATLRNLTSAKVRKLTSATLRKLNITPRQITGLLDLRIRLWTRYKRDVERRIVPLLKAGDQIIVNRPHHYVRLQGIDGRGIIIDDPGKRRGNNMVISWREANRKGYFHKFIVCRGGTGGRA